ncbi:MAG TPA: OmpA family protein [Polyangiaceae bacterium]|nr:OmpA family protein [Polyangiaceae bacterium]
MRIHARFAAVWALGTALGLAGRAVADPVQVHLEVGASQPLGDPQAHEFGLGASGRLALEVPLTRAIGTQLGVGGIWLPHTNPPVDLQFADHGDGTALTVMAGLRFRPLTEVAGPWADANAGYVRTGQLDRFGFEIDLGYDWRIGERTRWDAGPYVGYLQIIQPNDTLRPQDAHVLAFGVHIALGAEPRQRFVQPATVFSEPPPPQPPPPPPAPPAAPPDRDNDGVPDAEDACPDVPGIRTDDPKTNGCPPAGDQVHVVKDRIEYDDVIHFDTDQAHVHHASWTILEKLARFINANPDIEQVDITGHADERGDEDYNVRLSQARAEAVRERLVHFGVDGRRLTTVGYGTSHPRAEGHSENEWRQNRRVEFIITKVRNARGGTTSLPQPQDTPQ